MGPQFGELVAGPEAAIDLARAALAIAAGARPGLDPTPTLGRLDEMAAGIVDLGDLRLRLFAELGFRGDIRSYDDPRNSFLDQVVDRRRGLPITLSVVMIEVGRRAGIQLEGIGMPAHFIIRHPATGLFLDPFNGGIVLDHLAVAERFRAHAGAGIPFGPESVPVMGTRAILTRMLANLLASYTRRAEPAGAEWVLRLRLQLPDAGPTEWLGLARALAAQGRYRAAMGELDAATLRHPSQAELFAATARALASRLN